MTRISNMLIPALIFYIVAMGMSQRKDIYASFTRGARDGMKTVAGIVPTLIGLMIAVGVLRASGFLEAAGGLIGRAVTLLSDDFPNELISLFVVKLFSASARDRACARHLQGVRHGLLCGACDIARACQHRDGFLYHVRLFMAAKVTKTRWTLAGALLSTFAGLAASVVLAGILAR